MYTYKLTLLGPLFYRTRQDAGAAGSTITDPWIGDLALSYAINRSLGLVEYKFGYASHQPDYLELKNLPFVASVAIPYRNNERAFGGLEAAILSYPTGEVVRTQVYDIATNYCSEGYTNMRAIKLTENAPMRNWMKRQGLAPGNQFQFNLATRNDWVPPEEFTVRLGNTLECLAWCRREKRKAERLTANAYTLALLFNAKRDAAVKYDSVERAAAQYVLLRGMPTEDWLSLIPPYR